MMEVHQHMCGSANAEITRLRAELAQRTAELDAARLCLSVVEEIAERSGEINKSLTAERDEARREICEREARENWIVGDPYGKGVVINTPEREARLRGWDCFKEGNKTC
jgi:hypothetical protein